MQIFVAKNSDEYTVYRAAINSYDFNFYLFT